MGKCPNGDGICRMGSIPVFPPMKKETIVKMIVLLICCGLILLAYAIVSNIK